MPRDLEQLLHEVGLTGVPQDVYLELLARGPGTLQGLLRRTRTPPDFLTSSLSLLQALFLVQRQVFRDGERYYATHPKIAWRWRELDEVWAKGLTLANVEVSPPLLDVAAERRRQLMPRLRDASMRVFHPSGHTSVTIPRGRAYPDDSEFAYACAEAIIIAEKNIVSLHKPPMLPHLSLFWSAILDRREAGVAYRRCVNLSEVFVHGCAIVARDMDEVGIDLVFQPSDRISHRLYLIDDRILLLRNESGQGVLVHRSEIVDKHRRRIATTLAGAVPGRQVVAEVRLWAASQAAATERELGLDAADLYRRIIEGGRFTDLSPNDKATAHELVGAGFVVPVPVGGYSAAAPTAGFLASLR